MQVVEPEECIQINQESRHKYVKPELRYSNDEE